MTLHPCKPSRRSLTPEELQAFHEEIQNRFPITLNLLRESELRDAEIYRPTRASADHCDLCGRPSDLDPDVHEATDLNLCNECVEAALENPDDARAEVGMVGSGGGRS